MSNHGLESIVKLKNVTKVNIENIPPLFQPLRPIDARLLQTKKIHPRASFIVVYPYCGISSVFHTVLPIIAWSLRRSLHGSWQTFQEHYCKITGPNPDHHNIFIYPLQHAGHMVKELYWLLPPSHTHSYTGISLLLTSYCR